MPTALQTGTETALAVKHFYEQAGCWVYSTSQQATRRTQTTKGLWDLFVMHQRVSGGWWHEAKVPGADLTWDQAVFATRCQATGQRKVWGGVREATVFLREVGVLA